MERTELRGVLNSPEFVDEAPATVYAKLLDQGVYLGSVSTMYRVLHDHDEVRERRRQATHPAAKKPELLATKPNEIWSWDISKLAGVDSVAEKLGGHVVPQVLELQAVEVESATEPVETLGGAIGVPGQMACGIAGEHVGVVGQGDADADGAFAAAAEVGLEHLDRRRVEC